MEEILELDIDPAEEGEEIIVTPEPAPISPPVSHMPSSVSMEAWRNVEEMLITLSNNVRTGLGDVREDVKGLLGEVRKMNGNVEGQLSKLGITMDEFRELLRAATVEEEPKGNPKADAPLLKPRKQGYASRKVTR